MDDSLIERLRNADEDDVELALEGSYVEDVLGSVAPDVLLEFFKRMLGAIVDEEET